MLPASSSADFNDSPRSNNEVTPRDALSNLPVSESPRKLLAHGSRKVRKKKPECDLTRWIAGGSLALPTGARQQRRLFRYTADIATPTANDAKKLLESFKTALNIKSFEATLNQISQDLYQRKAQIDYIDKDHPKWAQTLTTSYEEMLRAWTEADSFYQIIPLLDDPKKISEALTCMITLQASIPPLELKRKELLCLLESPQHQEALQFYKVVKRDCKVLRNKLTLEEKVQGLASLLEKVETVIADKKRILPGLERVVVEQTSLLYEELLRFVKYTASKFATELPLPPEQLQAREVEVDQNGMQAALAAEHPANPDETEGSSWGWSLIGYGWAWGSYNKVPSPRQVVPIEVTSTKVTTIFSKIKALEGTLIATVLPDRQTKNPESTEATRQLLEEYIATCSADPLKNEDDFRGGKLFTTTKGIGPYRELREPVEILRSSAKCLERLLTTIKERRNALCKGNLEPLENFSSLASEARHYETILNELIARICTQEDVLINLPITNRVHAGWYYVARMLAKANDVKVYVRQFRKLTRSNFTSYPTAIKHLIEYLHPKDPALAKSKDYFNSKIAANNLWISLQSAIVLKKTRNAQRFTEKLSNKIYDAIDKILAISGPRTLCLTDEEKKIPGKLFAKTPLESFTEAEVDLGILPSSILDYLLKGFLKGGYFCDEEIDPEFDLVLTVLETTPAYQTAFFNTTEKEAFKAYYDDYLSRSDMREHPQEMKLMANCLTTIVSMEQSGSIESIFGYCKVRQNLADLRALASHNSSSQQEQRLHWIATVAASVLYTQELILPGYFNGFDTIDIQAKDEDEAIDEPQIYKLLVTSLFASSKVEESEATKRLVQHLEKNNPTGYTTPALKNLWCGWSLKQFEWQQGFSAKGMDVIIGDFFISYLRDEHTRALWRASHGTIFMEKMLYQYMMTTQNNRYLDKEISNQRDPKFLESWKLVVKHYIEIIYLLKTRRNEYISGTHSFLSIHTLIGEIKKTLVSATDKALPYQPETHLGIIRVFLVDIIAKYIQVRHDQFMDLYSCQETLGSRKIFMVNSPDHKKAQTILDELDEVLGSEYPHDDDFNKIDANLVDAVKLRIKIAKLLQFNSIPNTSLNN